MGRAPCCDKANVKKGPWSPEEDAKLKAYIEQHGTGGNWIALPQKIGLKRCGKSCRLRWLNYLRPNIKHGGFSEEEDNIICSLYISIGSRWSIIAAQLPGRTDNDIKNYWNTRLKKKLLGRRKDSRVSGLSHDSKDPNGTNQSPSSDGFSASALERMQLHLQLQNLQHPLSFYNSPALWPKLQVLGERILPSDQEGEIIYSNPTQQHSSAQIDPSHENSARPKESHDSMSAELKLEELNYSLSGPSSSSSPMTFTGGYDSTNQHIPTNFHMVDALQSDLNDLINSQISILMRQENQMYDLSEMGVPEESIWANDFYTQFTSSSCDSSSMFQPEGKFQEYLIAYDL